MFYDKKAAKGVLDEYNKNYSIYKAHFGVKVPNGVIKRGKVYFGKVEELYEIMKLYIIRNVKQICQDDETKAFKRFEDAVNETFNKMITDSQKWYLTEHRDYRGYYTSKKFREIFGSRMKSLLKKEYFDEYRRIALLYDEEKRIACFVDITNVKDKVIIPTSDEVQIDFVASGLSLYNSYIGMISPSDLYLLINIFDSYHGEKPDNKALFKEFENVLEDKKESSSITPSYKEHIEKQRATLIESYKNGSISKDEYLFKSYIYLLLENKDIESIYNYAPQEQRPFALLAYEELSRRNNAYNTLYRSSSEEINKLIYQRRKKREKESN